jgi:hypothetical protein
MDLEFDAFFDYANWTVGISWAFGVFMIAFGPLVLIWSKP